MSTLPSFDSDVISMVEHLNILLPYSDLHSNTLQVYRQTAKLTKLMTNNATVTVPKLLIKQITMKKCFTVRQKESRKQTMNLFTFNSTE